MNALKEEGVTIVGTVALFTYEFEKSVKNFADAGCLFKTLSNYSTMLEQAEENNYITPKEKEILNNWNADPQKWAASFAN